MKYFQNRIAFAVLLLCIAAFIYVGLAVHHTRFMRGNGYVYSKTQQPILANNDGYFYLDVARDMAMHGTAVSGMLSDVRQSMLMPRLLALLAGSETTSLQSIGFYLPVCLALFIVVGVLPWAMDTGCLFQMAGTALGAAIAPYWILRTHAGKLDTDGLIPGLLCLCLFALYRFSQGGPKRWKWLVGYILGAGLMCLWWKPGVFLVFGALFLLMVLRPKTVFDFRVRIGLVIVLLLGAGLAIAGIEPLAGGVRYVLAHVRLAFGGSTGSLLGRAIAELNELSPKALGDGALGSVWLAVVTLPGIVMHVRKNARAALFLLPTVLLGVLGLVSQRFAIFLVPGAVFYAVYGVREIVEILLCRMPLRLSRGISLLWTIVLLAFLTPSMLAVADFEPRPYFNAGDIRMAQAIKEQSDTNTRIWSWWDYGYFLRYLTQRPVFFDGGSQTMRSCFMAAYPLVQSDPAIAARWIRHFSSPNMNPGTKWDAWDVDDFNRFIRNIPKGGQHASVILCVPRRAYDASGFLYSFAHARDVGQGTVPPPVKNHMDIFARGNFQYDYLNNTVVVPEPVQKKGYTGFGSVVDASGQTPEDFRFDVMPDPYLVYTDDSDFIAVADQTMVKSVLFRLLGLFSLEDTPFSPLFFEYSTGGAWRVNAPTD